MQDIRISSYLQDYCGRFQFGGEGWCLAGAAGGFSSRHGEEWSGFFRKKPQAHIICFWHIPTQRLFHELEWTKSMSDLLLEDALI